MKKRNLLLNLTLVVLLMSILCVPAFASEDELNVELNGEQIEFGETEPTIIDGRTVLPARTILEALGLEIGWDAKTKTVTGTRKGLDIVLQINSTKAWVNNVAQTLDVPATIIDGRTYLPVRFIAESTGCTVGWDAETKTVSITSEEAGFYTEEVMIQNTNEGLYLKEDFKFYENDYTSENLSKLIEATPASEEVTELRANNDNKYRDGLNVMNFKYFDLYYPKTEDGQAAAESIAKHADKAYMFLTDMFDGQQVHVEVHLIREEDMGGIDEGIARKENKVTFVYINPEKMEKYEEMLIPSLVHEMFHNFFSINNNVWNFETELRTFTEEGIARIIGGIYVDSIARETNDYNTYNNFMVGTYHFDVSSLRKLTNELDYNPTVEDATDSVLTNQWWTPTKEALVDRNMVILYWANLYNTKGIESFKTILNTMGSDADNNIKLTIENAINDTLENSYDEFEALILND